MRVILHPLLPSFVLTGGLALLASTPGHAQEGEAVAPEVPGTEISDPALEIEEAPTDIESITVLGERLDATDVQDEAQAITAFSAEDLDRANITNVDSLAFSVPGLHVGQAGQAAIITLRGIGTENASITGEPGVAFHIDGINVGRPAAARIAFFDLETLDVKRGPQGLLGGKNSTSGSINLVTKKPHDEYEVTTDVLFGNYDRVRVRGAVNLPLGEFAATRFATFYEDRDGYLDNPSVSDSRDPFDADDFGLRGHLRLTPSDSLDIVLSYDWFKQGGNGPQADSVPEAGGTVDLNDPDFTQRCQQARVDAGLPAGSSLPIIGACNNIEVERFAIVNGQLRRVTDIEFDFATEEGDPRKVYVDVPSKQDNRYWGWGSTIDWDAPALPLLGETRVKLIGGFRRTLNVFGQDFDATDADIVSFTLDDDTSQYSSELQWSGTLAERLDWQTSFFYLHEKGNRDVATPGLSGTDSGVNSQQSTDNKSYGAALHGTYNVSDDVRFALGGRWIKDRKRNKVLRQVTGSVDPENAFTGCTGPLGTAAAGGQLVPATKPSECSLTFRGQAWGAKLDWRPFGGDHLLYASIDRGYKSGGFAAGTIGEYEPEKIWAYALGTKSEMLDGRLRLNLEGFFYAYENLQLVILDGLALRTENSEARMHGVDLEALASPIPGLTLSATVSFLKTETLDYLSLDPSCAADDTCLSMLQSRSNAIRDSLQGKNVAYEDLNTCRRPGGGAIKCGLLGDENGLFNFSENDLSRSPEWKINLWAEYEIPLGDWGTLTPRVQYTWQDDTYFRVYNQDFDLQQDFHQTDLKLVWRSPEGMWEAEAFVLNVEDEAPKMNILIAPQEFKSPPLAWWGPPRFFGFRVGFKY
jgi:iron complex outermembrane receptor protein